MKQFLSFLYDNGRFNKLSFMSWIGTVVVFLTFLILSYLLGQICWMYASGRATVEVFERIVTSIVTIASQLAMMVMVFFFGKQSANGNGHEESEKPMVQ